MIPGKIEQQHVIIDVGGLSLYEIPVMSLVKLSKDATLYSKHRSLSTYIIGVPRYLMYVADIVRAVFDPMQKEKVFFFNKDFKDVFEERIGLQNLEEKYFGVLPNVESNFFPPRLNN